MTDARASPASGRGRRRRVRALLELPRRSRRCSCANGEIVDGVNVENASYPLGVCAERAALSRAVADRGEAGRHRGDRDHRLAVRRLPAVDARVRARPGRLPRTRARLVTRTPDRAPPGLLRAVRSRLRRGRRPPERRQVDARERALRRQGRDRLGQAPDDAAADLRRRERARATQLVLVDLPGFQRPRDPLTERMQRTVDDVAHGRGRRPLRPRRGRADRRAATASSPSGSSAAPRPSCRPEQGRPRSKPGRIAAQIAQAAGLGDFHALHPRERAHRRRRGRAARRAGRAPPGRARRTSRTARSPTCPLEDADRRARPRAGART